MRDTHPDAERFHIDLLRQAGAKRRATIASDLTNTALERARRGIKTANPGMSDRDRSLLFIEVHYGADLAARVRDWIRTRDGHDAA